jgi:hypothetical protein
VISRIEVLEDLIRQTHAAGAHAEDGPGRGEPPAPAQVLKRAS